jgi:hypothetical protein
LIWRRAAIISSSLRLVCAPKTEPQAGANRRPVFDFRSHFVTLHPMETHTYRLQTLGERPGGPKVISYQLNNCIEKEIP